MIFIKQNIINTYDSLIDMFDNTITSTAKFYNVDNIIKDKIINDQSNLIY